MKILWLVNIAMRKAAKASGFPVIPQGGWLEGQLERLDAVNNQILVCCCSDSVQNCGGEVTVDHVRYIFVSCKKSEQEQQWAELLRREQPDVIHIFGTEFYHCYAMLKVANPAKTVVSVQGLIGLCGNVYDAGIAKEQLLSCHMPNFVSRLLRITTVAREKALFLESGAIEEKSLRLAQNVIGRTHWDRASVLQINPKVHYYFCNELLRQTFYEGVRWRYESCVPHTIFVSQASYPVKAFQQLIYALPLVLARFPDTKVRVSGPAWNRRTVKDDIKSILRFHCNEYQEYLKGLIESFSVEDKIIFLGNVDEEVMKRELLQAHVSVCCSAIENSSNSVCEAQLLGTPVIASYVGGTMDLIEDGKTGFLYPFQESNMLAHAICMVFEMQESVDDLSKREVETAMRRHDPQTVTQSLMDVYKSLIQ